MNILETLEKALKWLAKRDIFEFVVIKHITPICLGFPISLGFRKTP